MKETADRLPNVRIVIDDHDLLPRAVEGYKLLVGLDQR
jgi:hypothetical protein